MGKPERVMLAIGGGVLAIVLVAVAIVLVVGSPDVEDYPPDSPPGTVQRYLLAARERDRDAIMALVSARVRRQFEDFERSDLPYCPASDGRRVRVRRVDERGDRATVILIVEQISGSGLRLDRYSYEQPVNLVREDGEWKIDDPYFCV